MKKILVLGMIVFLAACSGSTPAIKEVPKLVEKEELVLPPIYPVMQYSYDWILLTPETVKNKFDAVTASGGLPVLLGVTPEGYKNLNLSINEMRKYIQEQQAEIQAYKDYYSKTQK